MSETLKDKILGEFPKDIEKISKMFKEKDFLKILNFLEERKSLYISSEMVLNAISRGEICELRQLAQSNLETEERIEKLFTECARLLGEQAKEFH